MKMLYLGNLPTELTENDVLNLLTPFAKVYWLKLGADRNSGRFRGFAFAEVEDAASEALVQQLDGAELNGRMMRVNITRRAAS